MLFEKVFCRVEVIMIFIVQLCFKDPLIKEYPSLCKRNVELTVMSVMSSVYVSKKKVVG